MTPELAAEGTARDVVRVVQQARRDAGLTVSDRIDLTLGADAPTAEAITTHAAFIRAETLATTLALQADLDAPAHPLAGTTLKVRLTLAKP